LITENNNIYLVEKSSNQVQMWLYGNMTSFRTISGNLLLPQGLFVTSSGNIYIDNGYYNGRVEEWTVNATSGVTVMSISDSCYDLFVDANDTLYCSIGSQHEVVKISLNSSGTTPVLAAGTGIAGSASNQLDDPFGLFVDFNFNLYVADCGNNRIQFFLSGQSIAATVAGSGASGTITLNCPVDIVLDADGYLFIVDSNNNRIVGSGPNGFRCLVGCSGVAGSSISQLNTPYSFSFDTYGNMFVSDQNNRRIQKFSLATNSCGKCPIPL
jgi:hypothetical protein